MNNKPFNFGPVALTTTSTTNILNPPGTLGGVNGSGDFSSGSCFILVKHIRIVNKTSSAATFSLWLGASHSNVAGTEIVGQGYSVAANSAFDYYSPGLRLNNTDYLVGGANTDAALTLEGEGEIGVA